MPADGVIAKYSKLHDVEFERTDGSPVEDLDSPIWYSSGSKLYMGPVSGGGTAGGSFSLGVSTGGNTQGLTGVTGSRVVLAGEGAITAIQSRNANGATITLSAPVQSEQTQGRFNLTLAGNTDGVLQEVSSGTLTLAGGPNITLSQNGNAITISGAAGGTGTQTDQTLGLYAEGNTTGQSSSTTRDARSVSLRGDGAVSVGFSGGSIRISAPVQSVQPETQTFVAGVGNSETTYTSGTVRLSELGAVTIRSTTGQQLQISVNAQSVQPETQTFLGGLAASNTTYTSGTVTIVGSGDITVQSGTGQRIIISGSQSVQPETQTFIGGISASDTLYTSGTVRITGVGGGITVSTNTGQRIDLSVAAPVAQTGTQFSAGVSGGNTSNHSGTVAGRLVLAGGNGVTLSGSTNGASMSVTISGVTQSVQTQSRFNLTLSGNTAGVMAQISSGTMTLAGGNRITLSQNGNAVTISGPDAQTGISSIVASDATYTSGSVQFTGSGIVTVRSSANQRVVIDASQSVQTQNMVALTLSGNTSGVQALMSSGTVTIAGGNNITVSQNGNAITISGANVGGAQTGISGLANSQTTFTSGTVSLSELGGGITIRSTTGNQFQFSVNSQTGTQFSAGISGGNTAGDTGTVAGRVVLAGGNNITLSGSTNGASETITIVGPNTLPSFSGGISGGNTSGDTGATGTRLVFAGGNNITLSGSTNANGGTVTISGANIGGAQTGISGIANSETTYTSGSVTFSQLGAITIRSTTGQHFQFSVDPQSVQTAGLYALGNTTGESSSTTRDARSISIRGDGIVSVGYSNGSLRISASQSVQPETQTFIGGISASDTLYTSGTVRITGVGGGITVSSNTGQRIDLSVAAPVNFSAGVSNLGNTAGDTGVTGTRLVLAGGQSITVSQSTNANGGTITISGASTSQSVQSAGLYAINNTTGQSSSTTRDARSISFAGDGIVSVGFSAGSLRISASQSVQPETQTFIGGISASDTLYTSGTVRITGVGGGVTVSSNTGQRIDISVAAPVAQTDQTLGLYAVQNTTGQSSSTTRDARSLSFAGDGAASVGFSAGSLRISVPVQTNQTEGWYAVNNTTGQSSSTTRDARSISVAGDGAVSVGYSAGSLRISAPVQTVESQSFGMSNIGNTSGTTGIASGAQVRFLLAGGNNITLSQSLNGASGTITISAFNQSAQSLGMYAVQNTTGQSSSTTMDARTLSIAGDGAVSVGYSAGSLRISAPVQTNQTLGLYALGNTTGQSSSTTRDARSLSVEGAGIVSVGYSAGSLRISATQSVQPETQTFIGGIAGSDTTYTSGTVRFTGVGGGVTVSSNTGQRIDISVAAQTNQTLGLYAVENTTGQSSSTTRDARSLSFAGDGAVSVGYSAGSVRISVPGTSVLSAVAPLSTTTNGSTISILGPAQFSAGLTNLGNTAGDTGVVTARVVLVGSNNITLSGSTNGGSQTISIFGGAGGAGFSGGVSDIGNTAGDTGVTGTRLVLAGGNNVTLSQSTNANGGTVTVSAFNQTEQTQSRFNLTISGNTAGAGALISSGVMTLAGGNNITLSQNGNAVTISGGAGGGFSAGISGGNTDGDTGATGTRVVFAGGNNITLSGATNANGGTVTISGPNTVAQTNQTLGMYAVQNTTGQSSSTTMDARTLSVAGDGAVSVGYSAGSLRISAPVQSVQPGVQHLVVSNTTFSSGTVSISGFGDVTVNTAANIIRISAPVQTDQTLGLYAVGNTTGQSSSTTRDARSISVDGAGIISVGYSGGTLRISATESVQTQGILSAGVSNGGNTAGNTQVSTGSRLVIAGAGIITASQATAAGASTISLSATQSVQTQGILSAGVSNVGNTQGNTQVSTGSRLVLAGAGEITLSQATAAGASTISISAPAQTVESQSIGASNLGNTLGTSGVASGGQVRAVIIGTSNITVSQSVNGASATLSLIGQPSFSGGVSNLGNSAGDTGVTGTRLVLVGSNNVTLSQTTGAAGATISINAAGGGAGQFSAGVSTGGNTAGNTGISGTQMVLVGSGVMSLSQTTGANGNTVSILAPAQSVLSAVSPLSTSTNGSTISVLGPATSSLIGTSGISLSTAGSTISIMQTTGGPGYLESWYPYSNALHTSGNQGQATLHMQPMPLPTDIRLDRIMLPTIISNASNSSGSITLSQWVGIYTRNASTLSLLTSTSISTNFTGSGTVGSYSLYGGRRWQSMGLTTTLSSGDYWLAVVNRSTTGGAAGHTINQELMTQFSNATFSGWSGVLGVATNASMQHMKGLGTYSVSTSGIPSAINFNQLTGTGTLVMQPPIYALLSGTV